MKPAAWRAVLLTFCAITAFLTVANVADVTGAGGAPPWFGLWGAVWGASDAPYNLAVQAIDPRGPAKHAGLRVGDLIDIRANSLIERFEEFFQPLNGKPVPLSIRRETLHSQITVVLGPTLHVLQRWISVFGALGNCWLLLFAALIARRRAFVPGNLLLSFVLVLLASSVSSYLVTAWTWGYLISFICLQTGNMSVAVWAAFAGCFARPLSRARLVAQWLCYALVAIGIALSAAQFVGIVTLRFDPVGLSSSDCTLDARARIICVKRLFQIASRTKRHRTLVTRSSGTVNTVCA